MLDACAAPGGKTLALATALGDEPALVVAADRRPRRLRLLKQNLVRAGIAPTVLQIDLRRALPFPPVFDLVLVDAPCSGLGTVRREPDIKWRRTEAELAELARAQATMLDVAARVVAPGGRLLYATCSSEPEENDEVVDAFLARHPEFEPAPAPADRIPPGLASVLDDDGCLRTLPHRHGLEAFFAAALRLQTPFSSTVGGSIWR
jgi:16S rRNA (cytosine967-C5)-methyltransferase